MRLAPADALLLAASLGKDRLREQGYRFDEQRFIEALAFVADTVKGLRALTEPLLSAELSALGEPRKIEEPRLMTAKEVAATKGVTPQAVALAAREGRLTGELVKGAWRFRPEAVEEWSPKQ